PLSCRISDLFTHTELHQIRDIPKIPLVILPEFLLYESSGYPHTGKIQRRKYEDDPSQHSARRIPDVLSFSSVFSFVLRLLLFGFLSSFLHIGTSILYPACRTVLILQLLPASTLRSFLIWLSTTLSFPSKSYPQNRMSSCSLVNVLFGFSRKKLSISH